MTSDTKHTKLLADTYYGTVLKNIQKEAESGGANPTMFASNAKEALDQAVKDGFAYTKPTGPRGGKRYFPNCSAIKNAMKAGKNWKPVTK